MVPWLAGVDPPTVAPRCRLSRESEIPVEARPLIRLLAKQRLLTTDTNKRTGEAEIEVAHETVLRQWHLLDGWLTEDAALLAVLKCVKRASRYWTASNRRRELLADHSEWLAAMARLAARPDLASNLEPIDCEYLAACRKAAGAAKRAKYLPRIAAYASLVIIIIGLISLIGLISR